MRLERKTAVEEDVEECGEMQTISKKRLARSRRRDNPEYLNGLVSQKKKNLKKFFVVAALPRRPLRQKSAVAQTQIWRNDLSHMHENVKLEQTVKKSPEVEMFEYIKKWIIKYCLLVFYW